MKPLRQAIQDYLALRRSLGFKLRDAGVWLAKFGDFLEARGATCVTTQLVLEWAQQDPTVLPSTCAQRLGYVRGFARHQVAADPRTEIPPLGLLPFRPRRARPFLYSQEQIERLLSCALELPPKRWLASVDISLSAWLTQRHRNEGWRGDSPAA